MAVVYPTGSFTDFNVPDGTKSNMSAGQAVVFGELIPDPTTPGAAPLTCLGWVKEFKILKEGVPMIFKQGMPLVEVNNIEIEKTITMTWKGYEWNMNLFSLQNGNAPVDATVPDSFFWGIGDTANKTHAKFLIFHKTLNGRYIWISVWNAVGDGNFNLEFIDDDWMSFPFAFNIEKGVNGFDDAALTENYMYQIEETNLQTP